MSPFTFIHYFNNFRLDENNICKIKDAMQTNPNEEICSLNIKSSLLLQVNSKQLIDNKNTLIDKESGLVIINNSRIDNRKSLIKQLKLEDNIKDADLILNLYLKYKEESFKLIEGPFAFIIFNNSNRNVIAAKDFFGQSSLYYFINENFFIASSNIFPLLQCNKINGKSLNSKKILEFIFQEFEKDDKTIYQDISKLKGGHFLKIKDKRIFQKEYFNFNKNINFFHNRKIANKELKDTFLKVIKEQASIYDGLISSTLSGGLDSSSIASVLSSTNKDKEKTKLHTISSFFNGLSDKDFDLTNESQYINDALNYINSKNTKLMLFYDKHGPLYDIKNNWINSELPCGIINGYMHSKIYEQVKKVRSDILFDGLFGDEVISHGTNKLYEDIIKCNLVNYFREISYLKKSNMIGSVKNKIMQDLLKPLYNYIVNFKNTKKKFGLYFSLNDFSNIIKINENTSDFIKIYKNTRLHQFRSDHEEQIKLYNSGIIEHSIEQLNQLAKNNNINLVFPFLDKRIINVSLRIPVKFKMEKGITRVHFKEALKDFLPKSIYKRQSKANISPFARNQLDDNYEEYLEDLIKNKEIEKIIDMYALKKLFKNGINTYFLYVLFFNLISLHLWIINNNMSINAE